MRDTDELRATRACLVINADSLKSLNTILDEVNKQRRTHIESEARLDLERRLKDEEAKERPDPENVKKTADRLLSEDLAKVRIDYWIVREGPKSYGIGNQTEFENFESLLNYQNEPGRRITELWMTAGESFSKSISVRVCLSNDSEPATIKIEGDHLYVTAFKQRLSGWLHTQKQIYSFLRARIWDYVAWSPAIFMVGGVMVGLVLMVAGYLPQPDESTKDHATRLDTYVFLFLSGWGLFWVVAFWLRNFLFPSMVFEIGDGKNRHARLRWLRGAFWGWMALPLLGAAWTYFKPRLGL